MTNWILFECSIARDKAKTLLEQLRNVRNRTGYGHPQVACRPVTGNKVATRITHFPAKIKRSKGRISKMIIRVEITHADQAEYPPCPGSWT